MTSIPRIAAIRSVSNATARGRGCVCLAHDNTNRPPPAGTPRSSSVRQSEIAWQGWRAADSMLRNGFPHSPRIVSNRSSARSSARSRCGANIRTPSASPYDASTGSASAMFSAVSPSITASGSNSSLWMNPSGAITNDPPPSRVIAAWKDAWVRKEGFRNKSARTFPSSARGSGRSRSRAASATISRMAAAPNSSSLWTSRIAVSLNPGCP